jgi:DNA modification methylase
VDLVLTDPPYGIDFKYFHRRERGHIDNFKTVIGDDKQFDPSFLFTYGKLMIFGANYFSDKLPLGQWLVWNKRDARNCNNISFADCELIWHNCGGIAIQVFNWFWVGYFKKGEMNTNYHPSQKPVDLMVWCIDCAGKNINQILDPFMGSGTTLVAAKKLGCHAIGIEISVKYCAIAVERLQQTVMNFDELPKKNEPIQQTLI